MPVLAPDSTRDMIQLMSISAALEPGPSQKSYEEVRIYDYLIAYRTTGKPPLPCPQEPVLAHERAARGLPPLFQPTPVSSSSSDSSGDKRDSLPEWQLFTETKSPSGSDSSSMDILQSITADQQYVGFSFEELREQAYIAGRVAPPPHLLTGLAPIASSLTLQSNGIQWGGNTNETFLSICSKPDFALHSFEELRLASMRANGRDVTSKEIFGVGGSGIDPILASSTTSNTAFSSSSSPVVFASGATAPSTPSAPAPGGSFSFSPAIRF